MKFGRGFTLAELILALACVALVAIFVTAIFAGTERQAEEARLVNAVEGATRLVELYKLDHGVYPQADFACFTASNSLPQTDIFYEDECETSAGVSVDEQLNASLGKYLTRLPENPLQTIKLEDGGIRSLIYVSDGEVGLLSYPLYGLRVCPRGERESWSMGVTTCEVVIGDPYEVWERQQARENAND